MGDVKNPRIRVIKINHKFLIVLFALMAVVTVLSVVAVMRA